VKPEINTAKPHAARVYDYYLGGKDHFAADRETGQALMRVVPTIRAAARENRAFLGRAVRFLVAEAGVRQFLDIGTGLPSAKMCMRWRRGWCRRAGLCMWTMTRSCWRMRGRC